MNEKLKKLLYKHLMVSIPVDIFDIKIGDVILLLSEDGKQTLFNTLRSPELVSLRRQSQTLADEKVIIDARITELEK